MTDKRRLRISLGMGSGTDDRCAGGEAAGLRPLYHSREWARELRPLPDLLVVTPGPGQEQRIQRLAWTCAEAGLMIRTTTVSRLEQQGPLAPVWLTMLSNQLYRLRQPLLDAQRSAAQ